MAREIVLPKIWSFILTCILLLAGPDFETTQFPTDPLEDQAILDGMEPEYYEENFDASEHELKVKTSFHMAINCGKSDSCS